MKTDCQLCSHHVQWVNEDEPENVGTDGCACELEVYHGNFDMREFHKENCGQPNPERICPEYRP